MIIQSKFVERLLAPSNGFPGDLRGEYDTLDGVRCRLEPQAVWNNSDGRYNEELDALCWRLFDASFSTIEGLWSRRLGKCDKYWHLVKMVRC